MEIAQADLSPHIVARELIALRCGAGEQMPVIGMFLGGAGLADTMLYCREKIYPLGPAQRRQPCDHRIGDARSAAAAAQGAASCRRNPSPVAVSWRNSQSLSGRFSLLAVTTLDKVLMSGELSGPHARRAAAAGDRGAAGVDVAGVFRDPGRQARPFEDARRPFRGKRRDQHRGRKLEGDPRRRDLPGRNRQPDLPQARRIRYRSSALPPEGRRHEPTGRLKQLVAARAGDAGRSAGVATGRRRSPPSMAPPRGRCCSTARACARSSSTG